MTIPADAGEKGMKIDALILAISSDPVNYNHY